MKAICMSFYLLMLSMQDIRYSKVYLWPILLGIGTGVVYVIMYSLEWNVAMDIAPGILLCIFAVLFPDALGVGDGLMGVVYGLFFGWRQTCVWLMLAFALTAVVGLAKCIVSKKQKIRIPFIPYLTIVHIGMNL